LRCSPERAAASWSTEEKAAIVAERAEPCVSVSAVARPHGLTPPQLFAWRRTFKAEAEKPAPFVPVVVTAEPDAPAGPRGRQDRGGGDSGAEGRCVIGPSGSIRVLVAARPVDFREGAESLVPRT
jgi:transposase-like protein